MQTKVFIVFHLVHVKFFFHLFLTFYLSGFLDIKLICTKSFRKNLLLIYNTVCIHISFIFNENTWYNDKKTLFIANRRNKNWWTNSNKQCRSDSRRGSWRCCCPTCYHCWDIFSKVSLLMHYYHVLPNFAPKKI